MNKKNSSIQLLNFLVQISYWFTIIVGSLAILFIIKILVTDGPILISELNEKLSYRFPFFENDLDSVEFPKMDSGEVLIKEAPSFFKWIIGFHSVIMVGLIFSMIHFFRSLVSLVNKGVFFASSCVKNLRRLAVVLAIIWGYDLFSGTVINLLVRSYYQTKGYRLTIGVESASFYMLLVALFVWALSIIFEEGLRLKSENELTV